MSDADADADADAAVPQYADDAADAPPSQASPSARSRSRSGDSNANTTPTRYEYCLRYPFDATRAGATGVPAAVGSAPSSASPSTQSPTSARDVPIVLRPGGWREEECATEEEAFTRARQHAEALAVTVRIARRLYMRLVPSTVTPGRLRWTWPGEIWVASVAPDGDVTFATNRPR